MGLLEHILRTPRWLMTLIWLWPIVETPFAQFPHHFGGGVVISSPSWVSTISFTAFLTWLYALYRASRSRTAPALRDKHGSKVYLAAGVAYAALFPLASFLYGFDGQPPRTLIAIAGTLIASAGLLTFAAIGYTAEAMHRAEKSFGKRPEWHPLLALLFIVPGIWFIHRPIQDLLAHPRDPTTQ